MPTLKSPLRRQTVPGHVAASWQSAANSSIRTQFQAESLTNSSCGHRPRWLIPKLHLPCRGNPKRESIFSPALSGRGNFSPFVPRALPSATMVEAYGLHKWPNQFQILRQIINDPIDNMLFVRSMTVAATFHFLLASAGLRGLTPPQQAIGKDSL